MPRDPAVAALLALPPATAAAVVVVATATVIWSSIPILRRWRARVCVASAGRLRRKVGISRHHFLLV